MQPDVILIDARFRVACFLTALLRVTKETVVLFDDYTVRPHYHVVQTFAEPEAIAGRMARFRIGPTPLPRDRLTEIVGYFGTAR